MAMSDIERQILIRLRAEGEGVGDRIREELARLQREADRVTAEFSRGAILAGEWNEAMKALRPSINFFEAALRNMERAQAEQVKATAESISSTNAWAAVIQRSERVTADFARSLKEMERSADMVGLDKLRVQALKLGDDIEKARQKQAAATEKAEMAEAEAVARGATAAEAAMAREEAAREKAHAKDVAEIERMVSAAEAAMAREATAAEKAAERKMAEREKEAAWVAALQEKETSDSLAAADREVAAWEQAAQKEAEEFAQAAAKHEEFLARDVAATEAAAQKEAEEFAELAAKHEAMLAREEAREEKNVQEIANARAQLTQRKREALEEEERQLARNAERLDAYIGHWRRLVTEGADTDRIRAAAAEIHRLEQEIARAGDQSIFAAQKITQFNQSINAGAAYVHTADTRIQGAAKSTKQLTEEKQKAEKASKQFGYSVLNVSYALQDLQYGFGAVVNNIPLVVHGLGLGAGLAGTLMVAGIGLSVFGEQIGKFATKLGEEMGVFQANFLKGLDAIERFKGAAKELSDKPIKVVADLTALEGAEAMLKLMEESKRKLEEFANLQEGYQRQAGAQVKGLFEEVPGGARAIQQRLVEDLAGEYRGRSVAMQEMQKELEANKQRQVELMGKETLSTDELVELSGVRAGIKGAQERIAGLGREARAQAEREVGRLYGEATAGEAEGRAGLAGRLRRIGEEGLAKGVEVSTPEEIMKQEDIETKLEESIEAMKRRREARTKARQQAEKDVGAAAQPFGAGDYREKLERDILEGVKARKSDEEIAAQLRPGLEAAAEKAGVSPDLIEAVARKVLDEGLRKIKGDLAARGMERPEAAGDILAEREAKEREKAERKEEAAIRPEVQRIEAALGEEMRARLMARLAENRAMMDAGAPVARSPREERQLQGMPYALPPEELERRLVEDMERIMRGRGATPEAAREAARKIAERGGIELTREAVATPVQPKVARRTQAETKRQRVEVQRREKERLREAKQQRPAAAPARPVLSMGWRGAVASALVGAVPEPEPVQAPAPKVLPPAPVVLPVPEVIPAPPIEVPQPRPVKAPSPEVIPPDPVEIPGLEVSVTPVEVPAPPTIHATAPEVVPSPRVEIPAPEVLPPPRAPMPAPEPVRAPEPVVIPSPPVALPAPEVSLTPPAVPTPEAVRAAAPEVAPPPRVTAPGAVVEPGAPVVRPQEPVRAAAPAVMPAPPVSAPAPRVAATPPILDTPPPIRPLAPRVEPARTIELPDPPVRPPGVIRTPPPVVEAAPLAVAPVPRVAVPPPDVRQPGPVRVEPPPVVTGAAPPGRGRGAEGPSPMAAMGAVLRKGADADGAVMGAMGETITAMQQLAMRLAAVEAMANQNAMQARRMRVRQPSLLPTLGFGSL